MRYGGNYKIRKLANGRVISELVRAPPERDALPRTLAVIEENGWESGEVTAAKLAEACDVTYSVAKRRLYALRERGMLR